MIFKKFETSDIVAGRIQPVSTGMWSDGTSSWGGDASHSFHTSSAQTTLSSSQFEPLNGMYYTNVYDGPTGSIDSEIYFSVAYGNSDGSGSSNFDTGSAQGSLLFPTKAIYNQYRNLLLTPGDSLFSFLSSNSTTVNAKEIYIISFTGAKMKDQIDPGQFQITLSGSFSGSARTITLIDDSRVNTNPASSQTGGKVYNLIQGSIDSGSAGNVTYEGIGAIYPTLGMVVLNASVVSSLIGKINGKTLTYNPNDWNGGAQFAQMQNLMFEAIRGGARVNQMHVRVTEYVPARHYFVRVKNQEYNYSNNPTFVLSAAEASSPQDAGKIRFTDFYTDPKVYITTVGLYNDNNDLVAVAKLSQPLLKDFTNEALIRVKIDV
jgi:hypothetical protein